MRLKKLIKTFEFNDENRRRIILGTGTRLHPIRNALELEEPYSTLPSICAKTWITNPSSVRQWQKFEANAHCPLDGDGNPVTSLGFRLSDGTNEYWWNGASWEVNTTDWNTEIEVDANISTFPMSSRMLQIVANLVTADANYTPQLFAIKVLYASDIEFQEDIIWRSFLPELREQIRPIADWPISLLATHTGAAIDLNNYTLDTPYNLASIDSVFDHTNDPNHITDLLSSYDPNTKIITLSSSVSAGDVIWIRFTYEPEISVTTSQEYDEIAKVPAINISEISDKDTMLSGISDHVTSKSSLTTTKVMAPRIADIEMLMTGVTASARDHTRLSDEMKRFFERNAKLRSRGMDEEFRLWLVDDYYQGPPPQQTGIHTSRLRIRIAQALFFGQDAVETYPVSTFHLGGDMNTAI